MLIRKLEDGAEATVAFSRTTFEPMSSPTEVTALPKASTTLNVIAACAPTTTGTAGNTDRTKPAANANSPSRRITQPPSFASGPTRIRANYENATPPPQFVKLNPPRQVAAFREGPLSVQLG